jgi:hypothetical protein
MVVVGNLHDQVIISLHLFTEKLPVRNRSVATLQKRSNQNGDHLLSLDPKAGAAELDGPRKSVLGFQQIGAEAEELGDVGHFAGVVLSSPVIDLLKATCGLRLFDGPDVCHFWNPPMSKLLLDSGYNYLLLITLLH